MVAKRMVEAAGYKVCLYEAGSGYPVLMIHGIGPGTSIEGNFGPVLDPLAQRYKIVGTDLIGFGGSERKREQPYFDVDLWVRQGLALIDQMPAGPVGVIGHSLGGAVAIKIAARNPRVDKVLMSAAGGSRIRANQHVEKFWSPHKTKDSLREAMLGMVYDPAGVTDEVLDLRLSMLNQPGYGDFFAAMFGGSKQPLLDAAIITDAEAAAVKARVAIVHGRNDLPCPVDETALRHAAMFPKADVTLIAECGHGPPREHPQKWLAAAFGLFG